MSRAPSTFTPPVSKPTFNDRTYVVGKNLEFAQAAADIIRIVPCSALVIPFAVTGDPEWVSECSRFETGREPATLNEANQLNSVLVKNGFVPSFLEPWQKKYPLALVALSQLSSSQRKRLLNETVRYYYWRKVPPFSPPAESFPADIYAKAEILRKRIAEILKQAKRDLPIQEKSLPTVTDGDVNERFSTRDLTSDDLLGARFYNILNRLFPTKLSNFINPPRPKPSPTSYVTVWREKKTAIPAPFEGLGFYTIRYAVPTRVPI